MNPYEVLGISRSASDDEIKRAYRELSRKYHPDSYTGNPLASLAEEKFKQVQEAYEMIQKERAGSVKRFGFGGRSQSTSGSYDREYRSSYREEDPELQSIYELLSDRRYMVAIRQLNGISNRTGRWYYYSAIANLGLGNTEKAIFDAETAVRMEPENPDFTNLLHQLSMQTRRYTGMRRSYGYGRNDDMTDLCCKLWLADSCCECMGGDICQCM